jgi:hypothetical protein
LEEARKLKKLQNVQHL